jgi:transcriptional regulator with XRE-family HTH domain
VASLFLFGDECMDYIEGFTKKYDRTLFPLKRKILRKSQKDIAELCDVSENTIARVEKGANRSETTIAMIGIALDVLADKKGKSEWFKRMEIGENDD